MRLLKTFNFRFSLVECNFLLRLWRSSARVASGRAWERLAPPDDRVVHVISGHECDECRYECLCEGSRGAQSLRTAIRGRTNRGGIRQRVGHSRGGQGAQPTDGHQLPRRLVGRLRFLGELCPTDLPSSVLPELFCSRGRFRVRSLCEASKEILWLAQAFKT